MSYIQLLRNRRSVLIFPSHNKIWYLSYCRRSTFLPRRTAPARSRTQIHLSRVERATSGLLTLPPGKTSRHNNLSVSCPLRYDKKTDFCGSLSLPFTIRTYDSENLRNGLGKIFDFLCQCHKMSIQLSTKIFQGEFQMLLHCAYGEPQPLGYLSI